MENFQDVGFLLTCEYRASVNLVQVVIAGGVSRSSVSPFLPLQYDLPQLSFYSFTPGTFNLLRSSLRHIVLGILYGASVHLLRLPRGQSRWAGFRFFP